MKVIFNVKQHKYSTRSKKLSYKYSQHILWVTIVFGYQATRIWNYIPVEIQKSDNLNIFK